MALASALDAAVGVLAQAVEGKAVNLAALARRGHAGLAGALVEPTLLRRHALTRVERGLVKVPLVLLAALEGGWRRGGMCVCMGSVCVRVCACGLNRSCAKLPGHAGLAGVLVEPALLRRHALARVEWPRQSAARASRCTDGGMEGGGGISCVCASLRVIVKAAVGR